MNLNSEVPLQHNHFDRLYDGLIESGKLMNDAMVMVVDDYLDGKPRLRGNRKTTQVERDEAFWSSKFVNAVPEESWQLDIMTLALTSYLRQERVSNVEILGRIASVIPEAVCVAIRHSGLVLSPNSPRRTEIDRIAGSNPVISELCRLLDIFDQAYRKKIADVEMWKVALSVLSPFELLIYASLYAFEHLVPRQFDASSSAEKEDARMQEAWYAINDLFIWKLKTTKTSVNIGEVNIAQSLAKHISPFLFPTQSGHAPRHDLLAAFVRLVDAQIELNSFISQSADAFSYDDGIQFIRREERLEIEETDPAHRATWQRNGQKLSRLHGYWLYRALDEFANSKMATQQIGRPENQEANRAAYIKAIRTHLQLTEVYGIDDVVSTDAGERANLFQALLSLELMSAFFQQDFLEAFTQNMKVSGNWIAALSQLALNGLTHGNQIRFPLTWSSREAKIANIVGWTTSVDYPQGSPRIAQAILDYWTSDWVSLSAQLQKGEKGLHPDLIERPILKLGQQLVQLPWLVGLQNNSTAAINTLRRLGSRRGEVCDETRRIEERLGKLFEAKGFLVVSNWHPPVEIYPNAGEVDLICARDGIVLVIEVKSTFLRHTQREAWLHATTTLRKAGKQLCRKISAVRSALAENIEFASLLGVSNLATPMTIHGWIIDTSIEHDHERFSNFLKVSLEEVLIALRDDRHLLNDPSFILADPGHRIDSWQMNEVGPKATLYPEGFTATRFIEAIEKEEVWKICSS